MKRLGIFQALAAAALFGISTPLARGLLDGASPQVLAGLLYLGSGSGLGILWLLARGRRANAAESPLVRKDLPWLGGAILFGGVLGPLFLMFGLTRTPSSAASLLLNLEAVFTAGIAWLAFRENVDRRLLLGFAVIVLGAGLLSWQGQLGWGGLLGPLAVGGACLCWGIDNNLTQKISGRDPVQSAALKGLLAGLVNLALGLGFGHALPRAAVVGGALLLGFLSYGTSLVLFILALRGLGTARTGAYFSLAPFIGALLGIVLWREPVTPLLLAAGGLMALGLWLHFTEQHEHEHVHEPLSHSHRHVHDAHHQHAHGPQDPPGEPHTHAHAHPRLVHAHPHYPDLHHRHSH